MTSLLSTLVASSVASSAAVMSRVEVRDSCPDLPTEDEDNCLMELEIGLGCRGLMVPGLVGAPDLKQDETVDR